MTERTATHATFTIERKYDAGPPRVFAAWTDKDAKAAWFAGSDEWKEIVRELDFRVGGRERLSGRWPDGRVSAFDGIYQDILPNERIVYSYDMCLSGTRISVSLATVEFRPAGSGTRLVFTEQAVFLDGFVDGGGREHGANFLLDRLGAALRRTSAMTS